MNLLRGGVSFKRTPMPFYSMCQMFPDAAGLVAMLPNIDATPHPEHLCPAMVMAPSIVTAW